MEKRCNPYLVFECGEERKTVYLWPELFNPIVLTTELVAAVTDIVSANIDKDASHLYITRYCDECGFTCPIGDLEIGKQLLEQIHFKQSGVSKQEAVHHIAHGIVEHVFCVVGDELEMHTGYRIHPRGVDVVPFPGVISDFSKIDSDTKQLKFFDWLLKKLF